MNVEDIQRWRTAEPFLPFAIRMKDGREFRIPQPDYIWTPAVPGNEWVLVADGKGGADRVFVPWIVEVAALSKGQRRPTRRKQAG